jgi:ribosome-associated protein
VQQPRETQIAARKLKTSTSQKSLLKLVETSLDNDKAEEIVTIDLKDKTAIADYMVIATGRSQRQIAAMADHLVEKLKAKGLGTIPVEGRDQGDWVLVDAGDIVVHLFRPDVRAHYSLEKMWREVWPEEAESTVIAVGG